MQRRPGFFQRLGAALSRIVGGSNNPPAQPKYDSPSDYETVEDVQITNQPTQLSIPQDDQISYPSTNSEVRYLSSDNPRVLSRWTVGYAGGPPLSASDFRDLMNIVPNMDAYTVTVGGTRYLEYPNKDGLTMYLSYRFGSGAIARALSVSDAIEASEEINYILENEPTEWWNEIFEISVIDRVADRADIL